MKQEDPFKNTFSQPFEEVTPSEKFTENVMQRIEMNLNEEKEIKPLISNRVWAIIGFSYISVFLLSIFSDFPSPSFDNWFSSFETPELITEQFIENIQVVFNLIFVGASLILSDFLFNIKTKRN